MGENPQIPVTREFSAGGVVYRKFKIPNDKFEIRWLVTKVGYSSRIFNPDTWRLPKGWFDDAGQGIPGPLASGKIKAKEEDLRTAALKEVGEEGGVEAKIIDKIGTSKFYFTSTRGRVLKFVTFYLMKWVRDLPEGHDDETSEVDWLSFNDARKKLTFSNEQKVLDQAKEILKRWRKGRDSNPR